jgi:colanic acid/amylovoran biosynthesis protein
VTNAVLSNSGDAAIFQAIRESLTSAGVSGPSEIVAFDSNARITSALYPEWQIYQQVSQVAPGERRPWFLVRQGLLLLGLWLLTLQPRALRWLAGSKLALIAPGGRSLAALNGCDVVISSGGTYLVDHYNFTHRYLELQVAKSLGKPVILWTQSMGPFSSRRSKWLAQRLSHAVDGVACRDSQSARNWVSNTGFQGRLIQAPDAVFALSPGAALGDPPGPLREAIISVRDWSLDLAGNVLAVDEYERMMLAAAQELHGHGWRSTAMSTCQGVETYAYDDSQVAQRIYSRAPVSVDGAFHTPDQLLNELRRRQLVITTRMHLAILALICRVPVIAVAYEFKTLELFNSVGLKHAVVRLEDASSEWMQDAIRRAIQDPGAFCLTQGQLEDLRESAGMPVKLLPAMPFT